MKLAFFISLFCFVFLATISQAQESPKWTVRGGIDKKTSWKMGARYQENQSQFGLAFWPGIGKKDRVSNSTSFQVDFLYHFAGLPTLSTRRPWYVRNAITYQIAPATNYKTLRGYYYLHVGREFNITKQIGIFGDVGLDIRLSETYKNISPDAQIPDDVGTPYSVGYEIGAFFRF